MGAHVGLTQRTLALVEDAEWIAKTGGTLDEAARRLNISEGGLRRALRRSNRNDVMERLMTNRPGWVDYLPGGLLPGARDETQRRRENRRKTLSLG